MITLSLLHPVKHVPVQVWTFQNETTIRIGRSTDNQVILYSAVVSRHHVELRRLGNGWEIVNLGTNGTYLDGKRITQVVATDGAIIRLARSGPNIQIRFGEGAIDSVPRGLDTEKTSGQRGELTNTPTEVTDYNISDIPDLERQSVSSDFSSNYRPGTIPVPTHLSLSPEQTKALATPNNPATSACRHSRAKSLFCPDCGTPTQTLRTVGEYDLLQVLGQGAIGITYLGWHHGHTVVVKTLNEQWANQPKAHAALEYEADLLRAIHHPRIPHILDFFLVAGQPYLVMERMQGTSLQQFVSTHGSVPLNQAIAWLLDLCDTLEYLHRQVPPVTHRGICPSSLLRLATATSAIALVGFGQVKASILGVEQALHKGYSAPEALEVSATPATDLFSLGFVLAYLVTGQSPSAFYADSGSGDCIAAESIPEFPSGGLDLLRKLTHPQADQRYQSAAEVSAALRSLLVSA